MFLFHGNISLIHPEISQLKSPVSEDCPDSASIGCGSMRSSLALRRVSAATCHSGAELYLIFGRHFTKASFVQ